MKNIQAHACGISPDSKAECDNRRVVQDIETVFCSCGEPCGDKVLLQHFQRTRKVKKKEVLPQYDEEEIEQLSKVG